MVAISLIFLHHLNILDGLMELEKRNQLFRYKRTLEFVEDEWNNCVPEEMQSLINQWNDYLLDIEDHSSVSLPGDQRNPYEAILGEEAYDAYKRGVKVVKDKWKGYDHSAFESVALEKAYKLKDERFGLIFISVINIAKDERDRQSRIRSHEWLTSDDNYSFANEVVNDIDAILSEITKESKERNTVEEELRNPSTTRFSPINVFIDENYTFTEWQQIRESLVMYLAFPGGLPLVLRLEMEAVFTRLSLKEKISLMKYTTRSNSRSDEKTVERLSKNYLSSLSPSSEE